MNYNFKTFTMTIFNTLLLPTATDSAPIFWENVQDEKQETTAEFRDDAFIVKRQ